MEDKVSRCGGIKPIPLTFPKPPKQTKTTKTTKPSKGSKK